MYVVTGATGNTGKVIASNLLDAGEKVRIVGRNADKMKELSDRGAEAAIGDLQDPGFVRSCFEGARAVFAMIPPNFQAENYREYQNRITDVLIEAARDTGVKHVLTLSSVGAHLPEKAGVIQGLYDMEQKWNSAGDIHVLHLRPSYFMENILAQVDTIKSMGVMGSPIKGDMKFPMVATKDIGELAAKRMQKLDFTGKSVQYILGPRDVSYSEVAGIIGNVIGIPDLKYMEFPYEDAKKAMMEGWGLTENGADLFVEFMRTANEGRLFEDVRRDEESTTKTSIEEFAQTFDYVYKLDS